MADTMVVVDQDNWRYEERLLRKPMVPGVLLQWREYRTRNPNVAKYVEAGDRLFLFHARGEALWLAAVYEQVKLRKIDNDGFYVWRSRHPNRIPILDITALRKKLRFHTGNGLTTKPGALGSSLQSPRKFTTGDLRLLERAIQSAGTSVGPSRWMPLAKEASEGAKLLRETAVYERDPELVAACLARDGYKCRLCRFRVDAKRFPRIHAELRARVVQAHHVRPVSAGARVSTVDDLITFCPTCHAVAHAVAAAKGADTIDLALVRRFFRP